MFPKPGQTVPSQKWTFVMKVTIDGTPGLEPPLPPDEIRVSGTCRFKEADCK